MENALLELKGKLKMLYASYGSYLLVLFKFLLAFLVFEEINRLLPYVEGLDQIFVVLLTSHTGFLQKQPSMSLQRY